MWPYSAKKSPFWEEHEGLQQAVIVHNNELVVLTGQA